MRERYPCGWPRSQVVVLTITDRQADYAERGRREIARRRLQGDQRFAQRENNL